MKKVFLVAHVIICVLLIAWKFTSLLQVYCTKLSLLLKNTSENMLPKTAPPTANEVNNNNLEKKKSVTCFMDYSEPKYQF